MITRAAGGSGAEVPISPRIPRRLFPVNGRVWLLVCVTVRGRAAQVRKKRAPVRYPLLQQPYVLGRLGLWIFLQRIRVLG